MTYYTDDITLMPTRMVWRTACRASPALAPLLFTFFYARKLLRLRFRANYGVPRPKTLPVVAEDAVPPDARIAFAPFIRSCEDLRFDFAFHLMPEYLGNKHGASTVLLNSDGTSFATVIWFSISFGEFSRTQVCFSCHSSLKSGEELHTSPIADEHWHPELIPPETQIMRLPVDTPVPDVINAHGNRINEHHAELLHFTRDSLACHMLSGAQRVFDHMIENGYYAPLTPAEVHRLGG